MHRFTGSSGSSGNRVLRFFALGLLSLALMVLSVPNASLAGTTYTVNSTADPGDGTCDPTECTLREAIHEAFGNPATDTIVFNIPDTDPNYGYHTPGVWTIILDSALGSLSGDILDGMTQAANYGADTNPYGPEIEVSGEALAAYTNYWRIRFGSGNTIKGLVMNRFPLYGLWIETDNNIIIGNYIGADATGTAEVAGPGTGILILNGASNTVGGPSEAERNVISGNDGSGIRISGATATDNVIQGNYIGTDRTGTAPLGYYYGVQIHNQAHDNTIGPGNIIAHNAYGLWVHDEGTTGNTITQNSIHSNSVKGIHLSVGGNNELAPPNLNPGSCSSIAGSTPIPIPTIEMFSDPDGQGRFYEEGSFTWIDDFTFIFEPDSDRLRGPMVTATITDSSGNTSEFSAPVHCGCPEVFLPLIMKNY